MRVVITRNHLVDRAGHSTRMSLRPVPSGLETAGDVDLVEAWRMPGDDRLLWMRGVTTSYRVDPVSEYVIGVTHGRAYRLRRGRSTRIVRPGQLVVLDPALPHSGSPAERGPWAGRLLVVELPDFRDALFDEDDALLDLAFPGPVIGDPHLTRRFLALHRDAARGTSALEWQSTLLAFFADLAARSPSARPRRSRTARDDPAVRRAVEYLHNDISRNISLEELAAVAGAAKYRLARQFKDAMGVPPHTYQVALRVRLARRLLERGVRARDVAALAGFADQSHLNRHFRPRLGMTPGQYARATASTRCGTGPSPSDTAPVSPRSD